MKDESKRGHVGTVTWGHGAHIRGLEAQRIGGYEARSAKVQIGAELLCKGAKVNARVSSMEY